MILSTCKVYVIKCTLGTCKVYVIKCTRYCLIRFPKFVFLIFKRVASQQTVGKETIAFGLYFASVFPSSDILNGYVTNTEVNDHVALSSHRNSHLYIMFFHVL